MKTVLPLILSALLLTSTALVAQTESSTYYSTDLGYTFNSFNNLTFQDEDNFPAQVKHTFHTDQSFDVCFNLNSGSSLELDKKTFAAQSSLDLGSAEKWNSIPTDLDNDLIKNQNTGLISDPRQPYYIYHFTPASAGTSDIVFIVTDRNGVAKTITLSITIVP